MVTTRTEEVFGDRDVVLYHNRARLLDLDALSPPVRLARDDDALWGEWGAHDLGNTGLVLFGSGAKGDPVRELRLGERRDIDSVPRRFVPARCRWR